MARHGDKTFQAHTLLARDGAAQAPDTRTSSPLGPSVGAPVAPVDVDALARDVARFRRAQTHNEVRHICWVPAVTEGDLGGEGALALLRRVDALVDRLAVDTAGGEAIHRHSIAPDDALHQRKEQDHARGTTLDPSHWADDPGGSDPSPL
jgi:hypothetical protein